MFVCSVSSSSLAKVITPVIALVVVAVVIFSCLSAKTDKISEASAVNVSSTSDVLDYISSLGWEVSDEPDEIKEVVIPHQFDEVYNRYNEIQKSQGFVFIPRIILNSKRPPFNPLTCVWQ